MRNAHWVSRQAGRQAGVTTSCETTRKADRRLGFGFCFTTYNNIYVPDVCSIKLRWNVKGDTVLDLTLSWRWPLCPFPEIRTRPLSNMILVSNTAKAATASRRITGTPATYTTIRELTAATVNVFFEGAFVPAFVIPNRQSLPSCHPSQMPTNSLLYRLFVAGIH